MRSVPGRPSWGAAPVNTTQSPASASKMAISIPQLADQQTSKDIESMLMPLQAILRRTSTQKKELQHRLDGLKNESTQLAEKRKRLNDEVQTLKSSIATLQATVPVASAPLGNGYPGHVEPAIGQPMAARESDETSLNLVEKCTYRHHHLAVHSVCFKPNTKTFASASWDAKVNIMDIDSNSVVTSFNQLSKPGEVMGGLYSVAFSKFGERDILGCTSCDQNVYLWDCKKSEHLRTLKGHTDEVNGIDFHRAQNVMCTASDDSSCVIWDYTEGIQLRTLSHPEKAVYGAAFLKKHEYLVATACFDQKARVWDIRDKQIVSTLEFHTDDVIGIACSDNEDCSLLATGSDDGRIGVWDSRTWKQVAVTDTRDVSENNEVKRVSWSPCGKYLAAACSSNAVLVYGMTAGGSALQLVSHLKDFSDCVFDVSWGTHPDTGKLMLVAASHDKSCKCWIQQ